MISCHVVFCHRAGLTVTVVLVFALVSCYPERQATFVEKQNLDTVTVVQAPTKVFLRDASIALFPQGFQLKEDTLLGQGLRYSSIGSVRNVPLEDLPQRSLRIPKDSAIAMTYFEEVITPGRGFASFIHGFFGAAITPLSIYCIANPKACFGSCPTVYTRNGDNWEFQTELFSYSISRLLESEDLDRLNYRISSGAPFTLRVANEALETHNINLMQLIAVRHAAGTMAFPTADGDFVTVRELRAPLSAVNSEGRDILQPVQFWDDQAYRSDSALVREVKSGRTSDWIDVRVRPPHRSRSATIVLRLKNTLLSTVLFYEVVLGTQGVEAVDWTRRMNSDRPYAALFRSVYSQFSGLKILAWRGDSWRMMGSVPDAGPVGWKPVAINVPIEDENELRIRVEFFPDNIMIDYLAFDFDSGENQILASEVPPYAVTDKAGDLRPEILALLQRDDLRYLVTEPQDVYRFLYELPTAGEGEMTLFVRSKGYYTEWIRGSWIGPPVGPRQFDLFNIDKTITMLADLWIAERGTMESLFFRNRVPVTEDL
jgi:hypothetical protein